MHRVFEVRPSSTDSILHVHDYIASDVGIHFEHEDGTGHESHKLFGIIKGRIR